MAKRERAKERRHKKGLLLTPLIDVIFLIMLFFVLNTGFYQEGYLDVSLAQSETAEQTRAVGIVLTLRADGSVALDKQDIAWEAISEEIARKVAETALREVIIRADEALPYGRAVEALDHIRLAHSDLESIALQTIKGEN